MENRETDPRPERPVAAREPAGAAGRGARSTGFSLAEWVKAHPVETLLLGAIGALLVYFYGVRENYGNYRELSPVGWMWKVCGDERNDYGHGRLIPLIIAALVWYRWPQIQRVEKRGEWWGLAIAIAGVLLYVLAARVVQARIAAGSLPLVAFGLIAFVWGRGVARYLFFPCCLIFFAIPLPGLLQATNQLQIFSTQVAAGVGGVLGVELHSVGSLINSASGKWDFEVDEGCSGIRSLVALTLIAAIYGHLTQDRLWKKLVLLASALPLAILANAGRVSTIVLIAEYVNPEFAGSTYHNWSGFVFFLLFGLAGLLGLSMVLNGGVKNLFRDSSRTTRVVREGAPG